MTTQRVTTGILTLLLGGLLAWTILRGVGGLQIQLLLSFGVVLGGLYTALGKVPDWIVSNSGGKLTSDDDPANISPKVYLAVLGTAVLVAIVVFAVALAVM